MQHPIGLHIIKTAFGQSLPRDLCGPWSTVRTPEAGYESQHANPGPHDQANNRAEHRPTVWPEPVRQTIADIIRQCSVQSGWTIAGLAIEPVRLHLALSPPPTDTDDACKWLAHEITHAVHAVHHHPYPVFAKERLARVVTDNHQWDRLLNEINNHANAVDF